MIQKLSLAFLVMCTLFLQGCNSTPKPKIVKVWRHAEYTGEMKEMIKAKCRIEGQAAESNYRASEEGKTINPLSLSIRSQRTREDTYNYCMLKEGFVRESHCVKNCLN